MLRRFYREKRGVARSLYVAAAKGRKLRKGHRYIMRWAWM